MDGYIYIREGKKEEGRKMERQVCCLYDIRVLFVMIRLPTVSFWSPGLMFLSQVLLFSNVELMV